MANSASEFDRFRQLLAAAARDAFAAIRAAHPSEVFYAFAIYTYDDVAGVSAVANTEEALANSMKKHGFSPAEALVELRWSPAEYAYPESETGDHFRAANDLLQEWGERCRVDDDERAAFEDEAMDAMISALADLDRTGFFGNGATREGVTLFCSVMDSHRTDDFEEESSRRLNPPAVHRRFLNRDTD